MAGATAPWPGTQCFTTYQTSYCLSIGCSYTYAPMGVCGTGAPFSSCTTIDGNPVPIPCSDASQCATGFCSDGVCCDSACDQPLQQCNLPGQAGTCATTAAGAPAASNTGLLAMLGVLLLAAFVALRVRRQV